MNIEIDNYNTAVENSEQGMAGDYYHDQPPFKGAPGFIPPVPLDEDGIPLLTADEVVFKYIELEIGGANYLAILTPWVVSGGPGKRYVGMIAEARE